MESASDTQKEHSDIQISKAHLFSLGRKTGQVGCPSCIVADPQNTRLWDEINKECHNQISRHNT
jgi:hypothetical protein